MWSDTRVDIASPPVLELAGVRARYGAVEVLHGVDLTVAAGSVIALLGANGAGKTTTLSVVSGLHRPSSGEVRMLGISTVGMTADELARAGVCLVPEGRGVFPNLTVRENLLMVTFAGIPAGDIEERAYGRFPQLASRRRQLAGTLSGGEQQMLAMARATATEPALLLIDELSMGLAPIIVSQLYEVVRELAAGGLSIVVVEQFADTVLAVADSAAVMVHGRVSRVGTPDEVRDYLAGAYLGAAG